MTAFCIEDASVILGENMVEASLCNALASDYFHPAMLAAIARLDAEHRASRSRLWQLVSVGPAGAMKLEDRDITTLGKRADLVLIDCSDGRVPATTPNWVAGRTAYLGNPLH